jgi:hypothetical protein
MPADQISALQLHLFATDSPAYQEALARYEEIRPILKQERTLTQHSRETGLNSWRLWRDLRRFRRYGLLGLIDRRQLPHPWGRTSVEELLCFASKIGRSPSKKPLQQGEAALVRLHTQAYAARGAPLAWARVPTWYRA